EAVDGAEDLAHNGIARRLGPHLDAEHALMMRLVDSIVLSDLLQSGHQVRRRGEVLQLLRELGAIALDDAGNQLLLRGEIDVESAGAHRSFTADVLHRGAVEAGAGKAQLGRVEDVLPAGALRVWFELRHVT